MLLVVREKKSSAKIPDPLKVKIKICYSKGKFIA